MTETDKRVSDQLVRIVQIIFGFVIAQSLGRYESVILSPLEPAHRLQSVALLGLYLTAILSWIDWHVTMAIRPYNFNPKAGRRLTEELRLFSDLFIVSVYAFTLLSVGRLSGASSAAEAELYILGYTLTFVGYLASGLLRRVAYGKVASNLTPITAFLAVQLVLLTAYHWNVSEGWLPTTASNWVGVALPITIMLSYRLVRHELRRRRSAAKGRGLRIGFDVDGVLADQITSVLPRIKRRLGIALAYEQVTDWRLPLGETDIAKEIISAMEDPDYILGMQLHPDAKEVLDKLYSRHHIRVITARPPEARDWTQAWLDRHALSVDSLSSVKEKEKSLFATDVLVDDYLGNLQEYLSATNGTGILVDQPWNRERDCVQPFIDHGRLVVVQRLAEIPELIERLHAEQSSRRGDG